jgi:membrane protease YdiL (CAAX protease family)
MRGLNRLAEGRPFLFVVGLFLAETVLAFPLVVVFNLLGLDRELLRLIIPVAQSVFMIWVVWSLGWFARAGFVRDVRNVHLYWYPVLLAIVPVLKYGTIEVPSGPLAFYTAALLFTGISEETLARGVILPALLPRGKWTAVLSAAALFSVGHLTNLFFEEFGVFEMAEVLMATFGFAILYGALFIRTENIWPLIVLHMLHDYFFVTSGTAGPFVAEPLGAALGIGLAVLNVAYGVVILAGPDRTSGSAA